MEAGLLLSKDFFLIFFDLEDCLILLIFYISNSRAGVRARKNPHGFLREGLWKTERNLFAHVSKVIGFKLPKGFHIFFQLLILPHFFGELFAGWVVRIQCVDVHNDCEDIQNHSIGQQFFSRGNVLEDWKFQDYQNAIATY